MGGVLVDQDHGIGSLCDQVAIEQLAHVRQRWQSRAVKSLLPLRRRVGGDRRAGNDGSLP